MIVSAPNSKAYRQEIRGERPASIRRRRLCNNNGPPVSPQATGATSHVPMNHRYMRSWDGTIRHRRMRMLVDVGAIMGWEEVNER